MVSDRKCRVISLLQEVLSHVSVPAGHCLERQATHNTTLINFAQSDMDIWLRSLLFK